MYCVHSSEWGLFGRNTRSAIQGTSSRSSLGGMRQGIRGEKEMEILRNSAVLVVARVLRT